MAEPLAARLNHAWRVVGTGISFAAFGIGGLLLGGLLFPLLFLIRHHQRRRALARRLVQFSFASHVNLMRWLGVMTYEIHGHERLKRDGLLILANHPTLIDVVLLISQLPNADCVVKHAAPATRSCAARSAPPAMWPTATGRGWLTTASQRCAGAAIW